jgi:hypothetical protein
VIASADSAVRPVRATSFEFLVGEWRVRNLRLDALFPRGTWRSFDSSVTARRILGGCGVVDTYFFPNFPGRGETHGFALRLLETPDVWRVWWASTSWPGCLDQPVVGGFVDGEGIFFGRDTYGGRRVLVRTRYNEITETSLRWEQAFSFDDGESYQTDWIMLFERAG